MKYKVIVYYDNMEDSEHVFQTKNEAINELHRLGLKYRRSIEKVKHGSRRYCLDGGN